MASTLTGALAYYRGLADREGTLVAMYDTELFGHWWWEGPLFLYELAKALHADGQVTPVTGSDVLDTDPPAHKIALPEGSWGEGGYHYVWLNEDNMWTWKALYPAERRMRTMAQSMGKGPAAKIVQQAGRELLLAESSDWQFQISTKAAKDYAEVRFADHIKRFNLLADLAEQVHRGQKMTTDDRVFLEECQQKDAAFPDLDVTLWAPLASEAESK